MRQANFGNKNDIGNLIFNIKNSIAKTDFHDEQKKETNKQGKEPAKYFLNGYKGFNNPKNFSPRMFQNYLVFIPTKKDMKYFSSNTRINSWKSNGMTKENIKNITKSDNNFATNFC